MSALDKEVSSVVGSGCGGDDGDEDDAEGGGGGGVHGGRCRCRDEQRTKKQRGKSGGFSKNLGKAKQVVLHPFTRTKKQLPRRNNTKGFSSTSSSCFVATNAGPFSSVKRFRAGGGSGNKGCYFCFMQPPTLDSPVGSQISDPEDPNFTYGPLKTLVEKNDFYSKECNPHLDNDIS